MRGKAKQWGIPTTLTLVYKPNKRQWFASITVDIPAVEPIYGSQSDLKYDSIIAFDLGTETAITAYDGQDFIEISNPRFVQKTEAKIKQVSKALRRKRSASRIPKGAPNHKKRVKASKRWKKTRRKISKLQAKVANQRKDWQHKVTSEIASRYDIGVTEQLNTKGMTSKAKKGSKRKRQKAGLNKSILSVGFGAINKLIAYKIEQKDGLMLMLPTKQIKPSQRCPSCGAVHKEWAELSNRYHHCPNCGFESPRDRGSVMVMYNVATNQQPGLGTSLENLGCLSSTSKTGKPKHTGSMKQLGQMKRQKHSSQA